MLTCFNNLEFWSKQERECAMILVKVFEEIAHGLVKIIKGRIIGIFNDFLFEEFPKSFDEVEVGRVWWEVFEGNPQLLSFFHNVIGSIISRIVEQHRNRACFSIVLLD